MKFSDKYELLESVTKGQVRTFLGREVTSKLRVVVHIFDCPGTHSGKMAGQWVLQAFRNLAPSPLGQVLEVGTYEDSSYAYIVTKMPDAAALQAWARAYRVHCGSTDDISRDNKTSDITTGSLDLKDIREAMAEAAPQAEPPSGAAQAPGEFTKAFWDLAGKPAEHAGSPATPSSPIPPSIIPPPSMEASSAEETRPRANAGAAGKTGIASSQRPAGSSQEGFTEAFMKLGEGSLSPSSNVPVDSGPIASVPARMPNAGTAAERPQIQPISSRSTRPEPGAFTKEFLSVLEPDPKPAKPRDPFIQEVAKDVPKQRSPGAFTREFLVGTESSEQESRGPIPSTAKSPLASPKPVSAQNTLRENREHAGFTNLFQAASPEGKQSTQEVAPMASNQGGTGEFTSFFGGPFQTPVGSQSPESFPNPLQSTPQKQEAGDFTRMFGSLKTEKGKVESLPGASGLAPSNLEKQDYVTPALERAESPPSTGHGVLSFARKSVSASADVAPPPSEPWGGSTLPKPSEMLAKEPIFPPGEATLARPSAPAGATQVFVPRGGDAPFLAPPEKSGPGEFTRIISGGAAQNLPAEAPIAAPGPEPRNFSIPAMPQIPGMPSPQMPAMQVPAMPGMATPQMLAMPAPQIPAMASPQMPAFSTPQIQLPQAPPMPKAQPPTSAGKMSYLPLIIIFNVLFIAAVLIVLYFAFKH